jgi:hypothetical protein
MKRQVLIEAVEFLVLLIRANYWSKPFKKMRSLGKPATTL